MSRQILAIYFALRWHPVRNVQLRYLRKVRCVFCKGITAIGIDEVMVGRTASGVQRALTIAQNLHLTEILESCIP